MDQHQSPPLFQLNLDANNSYTLRSAASWAKVLGIVGIIIGILCFATGFLLQNAMSEGDSRYYDRDIGVSGRMMGNYGLIIYVIFGLIFLISSLFAMTAGNKITRGLKTNDQLTLNSGFAGVRNYFAFWAILMIICLLLMLIGVAGSLGR